MCCKQEVSKWRSYFHRTPLLCASYIVDVSISLPPPPRPPSFSSPVLSRLYGILSICLSNSSQESPSVPPRETVLLLLLLLLTVQQCSALPLAFSTAISPLCFPPEPELSQRDTPLFIPISILILLFWSNSQSPV